MSIYAIGKEYWYGREDKEEAPRIGGAIRSGGVWHMCWRRSGGGSGGGINPEQLKSQSGLSSSTSAIGDKDVTPLEKAVANGTSREDSQMADGGTDAVVADTSAANTGTDTAADNEAAQGSTETAATTTAPTTDAQTAPSNSNGAAGDSATADGDVTADSDGTPDGPGGPIPPQYTGDPNKAITADIDFKPANQTHELSVTPQSATDMLNTNVSAELVMNFQMHAAAGYKPDGDVLATQHVYADGELIATKEFTYSHDLWESSDTWKDYGVNIVTDHVSYELDNTTVRKIAGKTLTADITFTWDSKYSNTIQAPDTIKVPKLTLDTSTKPFASVHIDNQSGEFNDRTYKFAAFDSNGNKVGSDQQSGDVPWRMPFNSAEPYTIVVDVYKTVPLYPGASETQQVLMDRVMKKNVVTKLTDAEQNNPWFGHTADDTKTRRLDTTKVHVYDWYSGQPIRDLNVTYTNGDALVPTEFYQSYFNTPDGVDPNNPNHVIYKAYFSGDYVAIALYDRQYFDMDDDAQLIADKDPVTGKATKLTLKVSAHPTGYTADTVTPKVDAPDVPGFSAVGDFRDSNVDPTGKDATVKASQLDTNSADYASLRDSVFSVVGGATIYGAYEVSLDNRGTQFHNNFGKLTLTFPVAAPDGTVVTLWHKHADGTITADDYTVKNGSIVVTVTDLSPFMIASKVANSAGGTGESANGKPAGALTGTNAGPDDGQSDATDSTATKTVAQLGDTGASVFAPVAVAAALVVVGGMALGVRSSRRRA